MSDIEKCVRCDTRYPAIGAVLCIVCQIEVSEGGDTE